MALTDLSVITAGGMTDSFVFPVGLSSETDQLTLGELQKSFTGLQARTTSGISVLGKTVASGLKVADNGYVGIDHLTPTVALEVGDMGASTSGAQIRLRRWTAKSPAHAGHRDDRQHPRGSR